MTFDATPPVAPPPGDSPDAFAPEQACVLTVHVLFRRPVFRDAIAAHAVAQLQARTLPWARACWLAWVVMPDHWQGLLLHDGQASLDALVGRFKAMTTRAVPARHRVNGWLWERSYHVRPLPADASLADAARLLVAAPRRAGLVATLADYPYWEAAWELGECGPASARGDPGAA
jgi:putative transposase